MTVTIAGAHGQIAILLIPKLLSRGHSVRGIIRNKMEHAADLRRLGAEPIRCDLEQNEDLSEAAGETDAILFAAGAGPGSGAERKWTVDRDGAIKLMNAAKENNISRYILVSAMGLDTPRGSDVFREYQKAKAEADNALKNSGLDYTILKPGRLTDESGIGRVSLGAGLERGEIPREDVAEALVHILESPETAGLTLDIVSGETPILEAVSAASRL